MICTACYGMLRGQDGRQWRGTFDLFFDHHTARWELERSAEIGCCICSTIWYNVKKIEHVDDSLRRRHKDPKNRERFISAFLSEIHEKLYRLDFKLSDSRRLGTFLLKQTGDESQSRIYTPISTNTSSDEVLQLTRFWMRSCTSHEHEYCPDDNFHLKEQTYPTRLIDLRAADEDALIATKKKKKKEEEEEKNQDPTRPKIERPTIWRDPNYDADYPDYVRLVVTRIRPKDEEELRNEQSQAEQSLKDQDDKAQNGNVDVKIPYDTNQIEKSEDDDKSSDKKLQQDKGSDDQPNLIKPEGFYVTLSHCWGGAVFTRLLTETLPGFQDRIPMNELPRTFREAIHFARRLDPRIRYMWIDSLCIIQDCTYDWRFEAATMFQTYKNSYVNISATAARNSHEGLYFSRSPHQLWGDEVNLNTDGIPRPRTKENSDQKLGHQPLIRRCDVLDLSFWEREVDKAPVNVRGWVLQERLLPPRVLHFTEHQVAWECRHLEAAERFPHGVPNMDLQAVKVENKITVKNLTPNGYIKAPIYTIPSEVSDEAHENWKRVVEKYSKTGLTKPEDKLIAIAGIAEMMKGQIRGEYVAGMWEKYLASQILWRVDPVYENGLFSYPSSRPAYRAPSWSWAAVDASFGITCAETVREDDLHVAVDWVKVTPKDPKNLFGEVKDGLLQLVGVVKKIRIEKREKGPSTRNKEEKGSTMRYVWFEDEDSEEYYESDRAQRPGSAKKEHDIVYLDSPSHDWGKITIEKVEGKAEGKAKTKPELFCVPARTHSNKSLVCLILLLDQERTKGRKDEKRCFSRVGLTVIPPYEGGHNDILYEKRTDGASKEEEKCCTCEGCKCKGGKCKENKKGSKRRRKMETILIY